MEEVARAFRAETRGHEKEKPYADCQHEGNVP